MPAITTLPDISAAVGVPYGLFDVLGGCYSETMTGDLTLTTDYPSIIKLDPTQARTVTLEAEAGAEGRWRLIVNAANGAEVITIEDDGGTEISTPTQSEAALLYCDGTTWTEVAVISLAAYS